jgi:hypothetical protein
LQVADNSFYGEEGFLINYAEPAKSYGKVADQGKVDTECRFAHLSPIGLGTLRRGDVAINDWQGALGDGSVAVKVHLALFGEWANKNSVLMFRIPAF